MLANKWLYRFNTYRSKHKTLYLLGLMIFFYALFDGSFSYMVPVVVTASGYSKTLMGIVLASSSIFGAAFDYFLSRFLHNTHFRRIYLFMFIFCFLCPALLVKGYSVWLFLAAMAFWGFYYDLSNFGNLDFVSRKSSPEEHSHSFGIIWVFRALGYTIAPLLIGAVVGVTITFIPYALMWGVISVAAIIFILLVAITKRQKNDYIEEPKTRKIKSISEVLLWGKIGKLLLPVLVLTTFLWVYDATFWTVGPLMSDLLSSTKTLGGLFLTFYTLPTLIFGFFVGYINIRLGKKRTAQLACLCSCSIMCGFFVIRDPYIILLLVLISSVFMAFSVPSLNGAYSDYVTETPLYEKEIQALQDFFTNIGYVIGPILAGFLSDKVGNLNTFGVLGVTGIVIALVTLIFTPKHITVKVA